MTPRQPQAATVPEPRTRSARQALVDLRGDRPQTTLDRPSMTTGPPRLTPAGFNSCALVDRRAAKKAATFPESSERHGGRNGVFDRVAMSRLGKRRHQKGLQRLLLPKPLAQPCAPETSPKRVMTWRSPQATEGGSHYPTIGRPVSGESADGVTNGVVAGWLRVFQRAPTRRSATPAAVPADARVHHGIFFTSES